ncbi:hypothetical protein OG895_43990 [Streptomyces sp. NBC_00201]|nr:hypothetical protein [Streptomyces sp. NBC_00201]
MSWCNTVVRAGSTPWAAGSSSIFTKYAVESTAQRHATRQGVPTPIA